MSAASPGRPGSTSQPGPVMVARQPVELAPAVGLVSPGDRGPRARRSRRSATPQRPLHHHRLRHAANRSRWTIPDSTPSTPTIARSRQRRSSSQGRDRRTRRRSRWRWPLVALLRQRPGPSPIATTSAPGPTGESDRPRPDDLGRAPAQWRTSHRGASRNSSCASACPPLRWVPDLARFPVELTIAGAGSRPSCVSSARVSIRRWPSPVVLPVALRTRPFALPVVWRIPPRAWLRRGR